jgi:hypothetical protein
MRPSFYALVKSYQEVIGLADEAVTAATERSSKAFQQEFEALWDGALRDALQVGSTEPDQESP